MAGTYGGPDKNNVNGKQGAGSRKNTFTNTLSKGPQGYTNTGGAKAIPASTPEQTANYYDQLSGLYSQYQTTIAAARLQRVGVNAQFRTDKAATKAAGIEGMATTVNAAQDRGIAGSSIDYQARIGVKADTANQIAGLKSQRVQDLGAIQIGRQQAAVDLYQGQTALAGQQLAQQQAQLAQQLETNAIISGAEMQANSMKQLYNALTTQQNQRKSAGGPGGASGGAYQIPSVLLAPGQIGGRSTLPYYRNPGGFVKG